MDLHLEHDSLACQLGGVLLGEGDVQILLIAGLQANQLLLKTGNKAAGTQLQAVVLALAALESNAIQEALEIDHDGIAVLSLTLNGHQTGVALLHTLQTLIHVSCSNLDLVLLCAQALVLAQSDLGIHGNHSLEGEAFLGALADHLNVGITDNLQLLLLDGSIISLGECVINGFLEKHFCAVHLLDHLAGSLTGAETLHIDLLAHLLICLLDRSLKLSSADLDGQCNLALFNFFNVLNTHLFIPPFIIGYKPMQIGILLYNS